ncbi:MAG: aminotransferase class I/II-fold pyridoxal phosphate-dependent enzyme, partial [Flavobacteriaceae bacterium]
MKKKKFETEAIRTQIERSKFLEHSSPMYLTSSFIFEDSEDMRASFAEEKDRNIYSRYSNPNSSEFIEKVCKMEGAEDGFAFSSGMSAVFSTFAALLDSGDHIISARSIFGSTHSLFTQVFPKWNISHSYFKIGDLENLEKLLTPKTKILFAESPTNPGVDILDLEALGRFSKKHKLIMVVDNCFASPYLQQPIKYGADLVIHSGTKLMDGQGRVLAGITVGKADLIDQIYRYS